MSKNNTKKKSPDYPPELEAGWYVIKEFIGPLLCSYESEIGPIPFNTNEALNHHFSGTGVFDIYRYSKKKYALHLLQQQNHYFRSHYNTKHFTGYHRSDKIAENSVLFQVLDISTKKQEFEGYYVILVKVDIDGHNGEQDCIQVAQWLSQSHFKMSYWEPSTHFSGQHGYLKIAIPIGTSLELVHTTLIRLFELIDIQRQIKGYQAPIDVPCGLPSIVTWNHDVETPRNLPKVSYKEYRDFRSLRNTIKELKKNKQTDELEHLNYHISNKYHYDDILNIVNTPVPATIKSSQCGNCQVK